MLRPLVAVILVLGAFCAPAQAARTVARDGPFTLRARERGDRLCMTLLRKGRYQGGPAHAALLQYLTLHSNPA